MKTHLFIAGCLGLVLWCVNVQGQNLVWAKQFGGTSNDIGYSVAIDAAGNVYTTGYFEGAVDFDPGPGTFNLTPVGDEDIFISKLDASGNFGWAKKIGGSFTDYGYSIAVDVSGNIYVTGSFHGTVDFNPGSGTNNLTTSNTTAEIFIVKLDATGNFIWAKKLGGTLDDEAFSIFVDVTGNVYVTGYFFGTADFDPGPGLFNLTTSTTIQSTFISKLDASGNFVWAKKIDGSSYDGGQSITVDIVGNVYVTGYFYGTADFDPGAGTFQMTSFGGSQDIFVVKLDNTGNFVWAKQIGGPQSQFGYSITVDAVSNIYISGYFRDTTDFDPGPGTHYLAAVEDFDAYAIKLDVSGNLVWVRQFGGLSYQNGLGLAVDTMGNVYTTGRFTDAVDFDPGTGTYNLTAPGSDCFICKLDASGDFVWATQISGSLFWNSVFAGNSIAVNSGNVYVAGWFEDIADFDPGPGAYSLTSAGYNDAFVMRLSQSSPTMVNGIIYGDRNISCSADSTDLSLTNVLIKAEPGPIYGVSDITGNYSISLFDPGNYTISLATQDSLWQPSCTTSYNLSVTTIPDTTSDNDFAMTAIHYCPRLTVELGTPRLRRCFNNTYTIRYADNGTLPASNAYIKVDFGNDLQPQSSTLPWSTVSGSVYTFPVGNLNINQSGSFNLTAFLDCNVQLGSTQCVTAHIYPDSVCTAPSTGWDKSETKVTGTCVNDSLVCFKIKNRSSPPSGNMQGTAPWRLYVNDTLVTQGTYQLAGQDSLIQCYPANGKTYRLEADQRLGHPGNSNPKAIVEACGNGPVDFGFVNTVAQDDADLFVETFCMTVIGSFDPNDKQVFPTGTTANKYIKPEDELEYLIRFQNTGNDTAFKVVIRDTIQTDVIDITTLTSGASSHEYTFNIYGHGIAEWTFDNILLPDSNVNEPESHGFVKFKAKLLPNITPGTIVTNSADIYFDFNAPVITNEVWNTVFDTVLHAPVTISGAILTESNTPVAGITVKLTGSATDSILTSADGRYTFQVETGADYTITPSKGNDSIPSNGLTTYDILRMRKHLLGMGALSSPYKIIAASEVNAEADTSVTTQDIVLIRSLILGSTTRFPGNRLWQFVSSDYLFIDSAHPFPFAKTRTYTNIISNQSNQNFIGIKLGDVNDSWDGNVH